MSNKVLLIGSSSMDLYANMYKVPAPGEILTDDGGVAYTPGGKGANAAVAFQKLGGECAFMTKLGADVHGQRLFQYYKELGIATSHIKVDHGYATGFRIILREGGESDRIINYPGANSHITTENILDAFSSLPDALSVSFDGSFETVLTAAKIASAKGIPVFIDASPANKSLPIENLPETEIFSPNEEATGELAGIRPLGADNALRACLALRRRVNAKYIVLRLGERGAFIYDGKYHSVVPAFPVTRVADTSGAGDAFFAALILEYLKSGDIKSASRFASCAGALAVTKNGSSASIPTREEVLNYMNRYSTL